MYEEHFRSVGWSSSDIPVVVAVLRVSLGLRISEALALKWSDIEGRGNKLRVDRAIVCQNIDDVKTAGSTKPLPPAAGLRVRLKEWHGSTQFAGDRAWVFASPVQLGRLPCSHDQIWRVYQKAAKASGTGGLGTHALRHTYRSWLDAVGTTVAVQQRLMRHADPSMTLRYGDVVTDEMERANEQIANLALNELQQGLQPS